MAGRDGVGQFGGGPAFAFDLAHGHGLGRGGLAGDDAPDEVGGLGQGFVGDDLAVGDVAGLRPLLAPDLGEVLAVPGGEPGEGDAAADGAEQRAAQRTRHLLQGAERQYGAGVGGAQPLQAAHRLRRHGAGGVVQDQAGEE